jgi:hypothetical protein
MSLPGTSETHTIQTACLGGFWSLGGSHVAGRRRLLILEAALGERLSSWSSSMMFSMLESGLKSDGSPDRDEVKMWGTS